MRDHLSYLHTLLIDCNGVAFSTDFPTELLEWGRKLSKFWQLENSG